MIFHSLFLVVRLVGGEHALYQGRVEVLFNGVWARICHDYRWYFQEADVVCRQLGYHSAVQPLYNRAFAIGTGVIGVSNVQCTGNETLISKCTHRGLGWSVVSHCSHEDDVGVMCSPSGENIGDVNILIF